MNWKNTTSYSKSDNKGVVRTTSIDINGLKITVTKHLHYGDELVMHCYDLGINTRPLRVKDMKEGQEIAIEFVKCRAEEILESLELLTK